jgi:hypothetical protein
MNTSPKNRTLIERLRFADRIYVELNTGDVLSLPYDYTKRLKEARPEELESYRLIGGGRGVHFPAIDEDISLEGIIRYKTSHELLAS